MYVCMYVAFHPNRTGRGEPNILWAAKCVPEELILKPCVYFPNSITWIYSNIA